MSDWLDDRKDTEFRKSLYDAARSLGWFLPQTEEEVAASETQIEASDYQGSGDPFEALDRKPHFSKRPHTAMSPIAANAPKLNTTEDERHD